MFKLFNKILKNRRIRRTRERQQRQLQKLFNRPEVKRFCEALQKWEGWYIANGFVFIDFRGVNHRPIEVVYYASTGNIFCDDGPGDNGWKQAYAQLGISYGIACNFISAFDGTCTGFSKLIRAEFLKILGLQEPVYIPGEYG